MAYAKELNNLRQELRLSTAGAISHWPKVAGTGNVGASAATYVVYDPSGTALQSGSCTITDSGGVDRLDVTVSAISTLDEDYYIAYSWTQETVGATFVDYVYFDVVRYPYGNPSVSLNDLQEERPDIGEILTRQGTLLGLSSPAEEMASVFAVRARVELDAMIRADVSARASSAGPTEGRTSTGETIYTRPNLILNRERLNRVERKLALMLIYASEMTDPEGTSEPDGMFRYYRDAVQSAWTSMGPLKYSDADSLLVTDTLTGLGRTFSLQRVQG